MKYSAFHGDQLEYNGSQGANGAGQATIIQPHGHEVQGRSFHNLCNNIIIYGATSSG